jgi:hypothetical protein
MRESLKFLSSCAIALSLSACGGGDGTVPLHGAASDVSLAASPTTTSAVTGLPFVFSGGVTDFGTTAATTVTFTDASATPAFSIASGGNTATGTTAFGSCIFKVTQSTFTAPSPLVLGSTVTVHPCNINVASKGVIANGQGVTRSVALLLGAAVSAGASVTVGVDSGGNLTLNGKSVGTVTLAPVTG